MQCLNGGTCFALRIGQSLSLSFWVYCRKMPVSKNWSGSPAPKIWRLTTFLGDKKRDSWTTTQIWHLRVEKECEIVKNLGQNWNKSYSIETHLFWWVKYESGNKCPRTGQVIPLKLLFGKLGPVSTPISAPVMMDDSRIFFCIFIFQIRLHVFSFSLDASTRYQLIEQILRWLISLFVRIDYTKNIFSILSFFFFSFFLCTFLM